MRTPLTYFGGKQRLARQIVALMPPHRVYLEAFAGGGAILFAKPRADREVLNDLDGRVTRFWRVVRDHPEELARVIETTPYSRAEWEDCRASQLGLHLIEDDIDAARRFLVYIDQSFSRQGSGWSSPSILFDRRGRWQPGVWQNLPAKIVAAARRLSGVALERYDALDLIPRYDQPDAVIYCDPPYAGPHRLAPNKQYAVDDAENLWPRLVEVLRGVERAAVILSGYPCEAAEALGWECLPVTAASAISARSGRQLTSAPERLWLSPALTSAPGRLFTEACL